MDLTLEGTSLDIDTVANIESQTADYFAELLSATGASEHLTTLFKVSVDMQEGRLAQESSWVIFNSKVDIVYRSDKGNPVRLDKVLAELVASDESFSAFQPNGNKVVALELDAVEDDSKILFVEQETADSRSAPEVGLIAATAILSAILVMVSSVLLYITGGWDALQQAVTNCLFEEVDDNDNDNYLARSKSTFQAHSSEEEEEEEEEEEGDEESNVTGFQTNPSGMLGGTAPPLTQGMGILTPGPNSSQMYGAYTPDGEETQMTMNSTNHLGITSMRKMPQNEESGGGLSSMIMQRLYSSNNK